jgi:hypothetical protein
MTKTGVQPSMTDVVGLTITKAHASKEHNQRALAA